MGPLDTDNRARILAHTQAGKRNPYSNTQLHILQKFQLLAIYLP